MRFTLRRNSKFTEKAGAMAPHLLSIALLCGAAPVETDGVEAGALLSAESVAVEEVAPDDAALLDHLEDPANADEDETQENNSLEQERMRASERDGKSDGKGEEQSAAVSANLAPTIVVPPDESTLTAIEDDALLVETNPEFMPVIQATAAAAIGLLVGVIVPGALLTLAVLGVGAALYGPQSIGFLVASPLALLIVMGLSFGAAIPLGPCGVGGMTCANAVANEQSWVSAAAAVGVGGVVTVASVTSVAGAFFLPFNLQQPVALVGCVGLLSAGLAAVAAVAITELVQQELAKAKAPRLSKAPTPVPRVVSAEAPLRY